MSEVVVEVPREAMERLAWILGPSSAAHQALEAAEDIEGEPVFLDVRSKRGNKFVVTTRAKLEEAENAEEAQEGDRR